MRLALGGRLRFDRSFQPAVHAFDNAFNPAANRRHLKTNFRPFQRCRWARRALDSRRFDVLDFRFSPHIEFSHRPATTQGQVAPMRNYVRESVPSGLTMRCSERLRVSRRVLSASRAPATFGASAVRSTVGHAPRHAPPSLSLGSLGVVTRHE